MSGVEDVRQVTSEWADDESLPEVALERDDDTIRARVGHEADDEDDRFVKVTRRPENPGKQFIGYYQMKVPVEELEDYVAVLTKLLELVEQTGPSSTETPQDGDSL